MNTEIAFGLLYPSVHLLLKTAKLAPASRRKLLPWSIHRSDIRLFLYTDWMSSSCRVLSGLYGLTLREIYQLRPFCLGRASLTSTVGPWSSEITLAVTRPPSSLVDDFAETGREQGRGHFVIGRCCFLKGTVSFEWMLQRRDVTVNASPYYRPAAATVM